MEEATMNMMLLVTMIISSVVSVFWVAKLMQRSSPKEMEVIPGSLGWPVVGESFSFISSFSSSSGIFNFMKERQERYGKVFKSFVLGRFTVFMTGREASKILLTGKDGMVSLNLFYTGQQVLGPTSLLQTTGDAHKRLRRLIAEPLSVDGLKKYFQFINSLAGETMDQWKGRDRVFVLEEASTVIGNMIMSLEPTGEEQEKFRSNFKIISSSFASLPFKIPGTAFYNGIKARDRMYEMLDATIDKRRSAGESIHQDFLESLIMKHSKSSGIEKSDEDDNKLTDQQLKDNILTLLVAGHDTTTAALTWTMKFLAENPDILEKLREEHRLIVEKRSDVGGGGLTWSEVNNMPYTNKVISETLRRATILPWYSRKAAQDFEIDGYQIKKGWSINLDVVSIHHDPEVFPDPEKFDPTRFDAPLRTYSYLGFGNGPRMCPGINLAKLEICVFIHHLVTRYKWRAAEKNDSVQPTLVRMPKNKYPVFVEPL
ncbi:Abscisic acid 8'-hydroxylase 3 [Linum perenne]